MNGKRVLLAISGALTGAAVITAIQWWSVEAKKNEPLPPTNPSSMEPGSVPGSSGPGAAGSGVSPGSVGTGVSDNTSSDDTVVSTTNTNDPPYEWTMERMMMARPMPMTGEERTFLSTHPNIDEIRTWKIAKFAAYVDSELGKKSAAEEASRWRDLAKSLAREEKVELELLKKPPVSSGTTSGGALENASIDDMTKMLNDKKLDELFNQMKVWREQISIKAKSVEQLRKEVEAKGLQPQLEQLLNEDNQ